ncbi:MaoC family dehydratase [Georgenia sp. AZ-5]|uniref:MaoC family dehydratase n=1 Tax=Georgenia sp. AZ-5 TaxID=3367526 RepID=UPI003754A947
MTVSVGTVLPAWEVPAVSAEKMKTMAALLADPNPIHWDAGVVSALGMGDRPVNQGPLNMAYVMNMLAAFSGGHENLRRFRVRFLGNVLAGDHLRATGVVTALARGVGELLAECEVLLSVEGGGPVLGGTATVALPDEATDIEEET